MRLFVTIPSIGTLYQVSEDQKVFWYGRVHTITPGKEVELSIHTVNKSKPTTEQIRLVENLPSGYERIVSLLMTHLTNSFCGTAQEISIDKLRQMYFLAGVELSSNNTEWRFTLEPLDVPTPYNFFPRFTIIDNKVVWSNVTK
jgi:hypothetical protein